MKESKVFTLTTQDSKGEIKLTQFNDEHNSEAVKHLTDFLSNELGIQNIQTNGMYLEEVDTSKDTSKMFTLIDELIINNHLNIESERGDHPRVILAQFEKWRHNIGFLTRASGNDPLLLDSEKNITMDVPDEQFSFESEKPVISDKPFNLQYLSDEDQEFFDDQMMTTYNMKKSLLFSREFLLAMNDITGRFFQYSARKALYLNGEFIKLVQTSYTKHNKSFTVERSGGALYRTPSMQNNDPEMLKHFLVDSKESLTDDDFYYIVRTMRTYFSAPQRTTEQHYSATVGPIDCTNGIRVSDYDGRIGCNIYSKVSLGDLLVSAHLAEQNIDIAIFKNEGNYTLLETLDGLPAKIYVGENEGLALNSLINRLKDLIPAYMSDDELISKDINELLRIYDISDFGIIKPVDILKHLTK